MKKILILILIGAMAGLHAMQPEGKPELARVKPRTQDVALLQLLRGGYYAAASEMINGGVGRSALAEVELRKPGMAEKVFQAALRENHINTINALIQMQLISKRMAQKEFDQLVVAMAKKEAQVSILTFLKSNARKLIDVDELVKWTMPHRHGVSYRDANALWHASALGLAEIVDALLVVGAKPNKVDAITGRTPLIVAVVSPEEVLMENRLKVIRKLLAQPNINLTIEDVWHYNVLELADQSQNPDVKALIPLLEAKIKQQRAQEQERTRELTEEEAFGSWNK